MKIGMLAIGDELLDGRVGDVNAHRMGAALAEHGRALHEVRVVTDDVDAIAAALASLAEAGCARVVCSGGLGPTEDDVTRQAAARWAGVALERDDAELARIEARFESRGRAFTDNNVVQAMFPAGAIVHTSEVGTASAFEVARGDCVAFFAPGVPSEFSWYVDAALGSSAAASTDLARHSLDFFGAGESQLATLMGDLEERATAMGARVGWRAHYPIISLSLKAPSQEDADALAALARERGEAFLVGEGDQTIEVRVGEALVAAGATVACAESCTAGGIAHALTRTAGSSAWIEMSWVTYANRAKAELVGVREEALAAHGAVSPQVACQMADGARKTAGATYGIAVTGIAGPGGGSDHKPVGLVHFALATQEGVWHQRRVFKGRDRDAVRAASVYTALAMLLWRLQGREALDGPISHADAWLPEGAPSELFEG